MDILLNEYVVFATVIFATICFVILTSYAIKNNFLNLTIYCQDNMTINNICKIIMEIIIINVLCNNILHFKYICTYVLQTHSPIIFEYIQNINIIDYLTMKTFIITMISSMWLTVLYIFIMTIVQIARFILQPITGEKFE